MVPGRRRGKLQHGRAPLGSEYYYILAGGRRPQEAGAGRGGKAAGAGRRLSLGIWPACFAGRVARAGLLLLSFRTIGGPRQPFVGIRQAAGSTCGIRFVDIIIIICSFPRACWAPAGLHGSGDDGDRRDRGESVRATLSARRVLESFEANVATRFFDLRVVEKDLDFLQVLSDATTIRGDVGDTIRSCPLSKKKNPFVS